MEDIQGQKVTENIYLCPDGKYRWVYEFNMLKNPAILFTIWKIFGILILIQIGFSFIFALFEGGVSDWISGYLLSPGILIVPGILFVLSIIAYIIVAFLYGWKYMVLFEMNEEGVVHNQMPKQFEKAQGIAWLTTMAGLLAGNYTTAGAGMLASAKSNSVSTFEKVKMVAKKKGLHLIKVDESLEKNQVYAEDADFEFVWSYISARCPNAKIIGN
ncbi:MAG: hypothetical protein K6C96_05500 [Butyrivibrio sp.]|nr:hypothetical protein [Butyrivibrio sp.]